MSKKVAQDRIFQGKSCLVSRFSLYLMPKSLIYTERMKKILIIVFFVFAAFGVSKAQQDPHYTHYMFNKLMFNPAYAGAKDAICAGIIYHKQTTTFQGSTEHERTPTYQSFSINGPLKFKTGSQVFGLGLDIVNDDYAFEKDLGFNVSANYHIQGLSFGTLAAGIDVGMLQRTLNGDKLKPLIPGDPRVPNSQVTDSKADMGLGVYVYDKDYYAGLSVKHLLQGKMNWISINEQYKFDRAYYLVGGYDYHLNSSIDLQPSVLFKYQGDFQADATVIGLYDQKFWGGLHYRLKADISIMLGMYINNHLSVGYAYDLPTTQLINYLGNQEIYVNYCFNIKLPKIGPRPYRDTRHL